MSDTWGTTKCVYRILSPVHTGNKVVFNTVDFVEPATNQQQSWTFNFVASFGNKSATTWIQQLVAVDFVADTINFVANTVDFVADTVNFSLPVCMGPKWHVKSTYNKVDRVEFNFVASVYRALDECFGFTLFIG